MIPKNLNIAIEFLTILSAGKSKEEIRTEDIANSIVFFPLVGILLGGICGLAEFLLGHVVISDLVVSLFPVIILGLLTRGLHLEGHPFSVLNRMCPVFLFSFFMLSLLP